MNLCELSDEELVTQLTKLRAGERETTLNILYHLIELENRGVHRELGYSSLFDYCLRALKYSEASSSRRLAAARALRENPELADLFLGGQVTLCTIATAAKGLKEKRTEVAEIVGKSKREVELLVAPTMPRLKERIRPVVLEVPKAPLVPDTKREERYTISFSVTKEVYREFEQVKNQLSCKLGSNLSVEAIFKELIRRQLHTQVRSSNVAPKRSRYMSRSLKQEVRVRDNHQCTFVSPAGVRCSAKRYLHFDHINPWALGGSTELSNLRLRCSCHNRLYAEQTYGREFISRFGSAGGSKSEGPAVCKS